VQTGKFAISGFRATGLHLLNRNVVEDFDFDAATEQHNPRAGALLSRKESATQTASLCAFGSEATSSSALRTTTYSTPSTSKVHIKYINKLYIARRYITHTDFEKQKIRSRPAKKFS
jgi:hypothetical protein